MYSRYTENEAESIVDHLKSIADMMERKFGLIEANLCLLYTSPSPRDYAASRMPSSA